MSTSIFIGTPCYRGDPVEADRWATDLIAELDLESASRKIQYGCANVDVARNELTFSYRASGKELFLFRDDDVFVSSKDVQRMIDAHADVIVIPYRIRSDAERWDTIFDPRDPRFVESAGLGMCLIREYVIDRLWRNYSESLGYVQRDKLGRRDMVHLFSDFFAQRDDGVELVKEDRAFFYRVRESGFAIRALENAAITHARVTDMYKK